MHFVRLQDVEIRAAAYKWRFHIDQIKFHDFLPTQKYHRWCFISVTVLIVIARHWILRCIDLCGLLI